MKVNDDSIPSSPTPMLAGNPLTDLRVAITGGTSGLGLALVRELLNRGARVAFVARRGAAWNNSNRSCRTHTALSATYPGKKIYTQSPCKS